MYKLIFSSHPIGRTGAGILTWKPSILQLIANQKDSSELIEAKKRVNISRKGYFYEPSKAYKHMLSHKIK